MNEFKDFAIHNAGKVVKILGTYLKGPIIGYTDNAILIDDDHLKQEIRIKTDQFTIFPYKVGIFYFITCDPLGYPCIVDNIDELKLLE